MVGAQNGRARLDKQKRFQLVRTTASCTLWQPTQLNLKTKMKLLPIFCVSTIFSFSASAQLFYGATGGGAPGELYVINGSGGVVTDVGPLVDNSANTYSLTGLDVQPGSGTLYGITANISPTSPRSLVTVDRSTARVTVVGPLGDVFGDISFDPGSGTLYGAGVNGDLYTINLGTGSATSLGTSGLPGGPGHGLTFHSGTLYTSADNSSGHLSTFNPSTGAANTGVQLSGAPVPGVGIGALTSSGGTLYGINGQGSNEHLITIDPATGVITDLGSTVGQLDALTPVPEPSTYAMIFGLGLMGFAVMRRRLANG